jgi:hypothetical protein
LAITVSYKTVIQLIRAFLRSADALCTIVYANVRCRLFFSSFGSRIVCTNAFRCIIRTSPTGARCDHACADVAIQGNAIDRRSIACARGICSGICTIDWIASAVIATIWVATYDWGIV